MGLTPWLGDTVSLEKAISEETCVLSTLCLSIVASWPGDTFFWKRDFSVATSRFQYIMLAYSSIEASEIGLLKTEDSQW